MLARQRGFVYYEADCFGAIKNPYVSLDCEDPSMGQMYQKQMRGPGLEERKAVINRALGEFSKIFEGKEYEKEALTEFYHHLAMDVAREKKRIGGDFVIANILMTAELREHLRSWLGPDLRIVLLSMTKEDRRERTLARHKGHQTSADTLDVGYHLYLQKFTSEHLNFILQK